MNENEEESDFLENTILACVDSYSECLFTHVQYIFRRYFCFNISSRQCSALVSPWHLSFPDRCAVFCPSARSAMSSECIVWV